MLTSSFVTILASITHIPDTSKTEEGLRFPCCHDIEWMTEIQRCYQSKTEEGPGSPFGDNEAEGAQVAPDEAPDIDEGAQEVPSVREDAILGDTSNYAKLLSRGGKQNCDPYSMSYIISLN